MNDGGLFPTSLSHLDDKRLKCLNLAKNQGSAAARDFGAKQACSDLLFFVDADVVISPTTRAQMEKAFLADPELSLCFAGLETKPKLGFYSDYKNLYMNFVLSLNSENSENVNYVYGCCCVCRRVSYLPWPRGVRYIDDNVWGYEYWRQGEKIQYSSDVLVNHQKEYDLFSLCRNDFRVAREFMIFLIERRGLKVVMNEEKFGHTSRSQVLSLLLAVTLPFALLFHPALGFLVCLSWISIQWRFWQYLLKARGVKFLAQSLLWTYIDHYLYFAGMLTGFMESVLSLRKLHVD